MISRFQERAASARYLNSLKADELFERFAITRVGDVTGLDCLGVPVLTTCRPTGKMVSVNAGKSLDPNLARAGAIAEGIEFSTFETPGPCFQGTIEDLGFPLALESGWTPQVQIALEEVTHLASGRNVIFPSSLVWLTRPRHEPAHFMKSSNGQATGASLADALVQGILECVERDQYVLRRCTLIKDHIWPPRVLFVHPAVEAIERANLKLFLFSCGIDLSIPVYWALIFDPSWRNTAGWGAHLSPRVAAERAVLEAIQSRAVIISGARDDIERRDWDWNETISAIKGLETLPLVTEVKEEQIDLSAAQELELLENCLGFWWEKIYYKHIDLDPIHVVKVQILGLEQPVLRHWRELRWSKLNAAYLPAQASMESLLSYFPLKDCEVRRERATSLA